MNQIMGLFFLPPSPLVVFFLERSPCIYDAFDYLLATPITSALSVQRVSPPHFEGPGTRLIDYFDPTRSRGVVQEGLLPGTEQAEGSFFNHAGWQDPRVQDGVKSVGREIGEVPTDEDVGAGSAGRKEVCTQGRDRRW